MTKLVVVESPKKAKTIKNILGSNYTVVATVGHIVDLTKGKGSDIGVDIENGFKPRYAVIEDKRDKVAAIVDAARSCDEIFIASDPDREGEGIAWHVAEQLAKLSKPMSRVEFYEITKSGISKGLSKPRPLDKHLYEAQQARRVLDRIVGFIVSPYLARKLTRDSLSAGRVQSVALKLIVDRDRDIQKFVPETFFNISATLKKDSETFVARYSTKVTQQTVANQIEKDLKSGTFKVKKIDAKERVRPALCPFTTPLLQQEAYSKYKFSPERTMKAAQALYEAGMISYIRTDSARSSPESIASLRDWLQDSGYQVPSVPNEYKNKEAAQDAHEAIRPTNVILTPDNHVALDDEKNLYNLIWSRFVASQMKPALYDTVSLTIVSSDGHELKAEGKILKYKGWLEIYGDFLKKENDVALPVLKIGNVLDLVGVKNEKKKTSPPARFNIKTLIDELETKSIGRPSTYANILKKILDRNYVQETKKGFEATDLGVSVVEDLEQYFSFMRYDYTADMEKRLDLIAEGKANYLDSMTEFFSAFKTEFQKARGASGMYAGFDCPNCGEKMIVRHSQFGYFAGCVKYPECKGVVGIKLVDGKPVKNEKHTVEDGVECPECGAGMVRRDGKFGPFYSCSTYPKCRGKRKIPFGKKCSSCGGELYLTILNGEQRLACMNYPACTNVEKVPDNVETNWIEPEKLGAFNLGRKVEKAAKLL